MALASSSSSAGSALRSTSRGMNRRFLSFGLQQRPPSRNPPNEPYESGSRVTTPLATNSRPYSPAAAYASSPEYDTRPELEVVESSTASTHVDNPSRSFPSPQPRSQSQSPGQYKRNPHTYPSHSPSSPPTHRPAPGSSTTPLKAQQFFTNLLSLPPSRPLPPDLCLQILTHKSYRYAQNPRSNPTLTSQPDAESEIWQWAANHNGRLSFLGRRAMGSYLGMFFHAAAVERGGLGGLGLVRDGGLEDRLDGLLDTARIGKSVGDEWGIDDLLRWDGNETAITSGLARIRGQTVESTLGAIFNYYGSPAAHRAFHLHFLPRMRDTLRDPALIEKAESMKEGVMKEMKGGILVE